MVARRFLFLSCVLGGAGALAPSRSRRQFVVDSAVATLCSTSAAVLTPVAAAAGIPANTNPEGFLTLPASKEEVYFSPVGFGLYKTPPSDAEEAVGLALEAGVRHFDTAADYGNEEALGNALRKWAVGGRNRYRDELFVTTKLSNRDQSTNPLEVKRAVKESLSRLSVGYADSVLLHSPLTDTNRRLASWQALLELREEGLIRSVGCCNFGPKSLDEIEKAFPGANQGPQMIQLELSPYNQHSDCVEWCEKRGVVVTCGAWSKLSGSFNWGTDADYKVLMEVAKAHSATKAQVLVRWAVQRGWGALPRSGVGSDVEKAAIKQNSGRGVSSRGWDKAPATWGGGALTSSEMAALDAMDQQLPAGRLGRTDGWTPEDVGGVDWDPTQV